MAENREPARTMALLWRAPGETGRGRKSGLTVDAVVAAGLAIADEVGLADLSMRRVADKLGVGTMSLYTYVQGKADLVAAMRDHVMGEVDVPDPAAGWRPALETYARQLWAVYHRHPWLLLAPAAHELPGPNETTRMDGLLGVAESAGLDANDMLGVYLVIDGYVRGIAMLSVDSRLASRRSGLTEIEWWAEREPVVTAYVTPAKFPALTKVAAAGAFDTDGFDFGLYRTLDGIEAHIRSL